MTTTNDRLAEIRARLTESGEIENERNNNLTFLLSLVEQLQGQLDEFATLQDRIPDDGNGDWGLGWDHGYNAALAEVRAMAARPPAQEHASGSNTPDPYTGEGTAPASPHEPAQAAIDTIARVLVGTDWDEEVPYTDIGARDTVAHLAGQIATVLAPAHYREAAASLRALGHDTAADRPTLAADDSIPLAAALAFIAESAGFEEAPESAEDHRSRCCGTCDAIHADREAEPAEPTLRDVMAAAYRAGLGIRRDGDYIARDGNGEAWAYVEWSIVNGHGREVGRIGIEEGGSAYVWLGTRPGKPAQQYLVDPTPADILTAAREAGLIGDTDA